MIILHYVALKCSALKIFISQNQLLSVIGEKICCTKFHAKRRHFCFHPENGVCLCSDLSGCGYILHIYLFEVTINAG